MIDAALLRLVLGAVARRSRSMSACWSRGCGGDGDESDAKRWSHERGPRSCG